MAARKVLVVDDDRMIQAFLRAVFEKAGYRVTTAFDAMQGSMMARQVQPDLIVLDVSMPGGGGAKVFERLRMSAGTTGVPILIHTSLPKEDVLRLIPGAADLPFVSKPADPAHILELAERVLAGGAS